MAKARLSELQEDVLQLVKSTVPHAKLYDLALQLDKSVMNIRVALDALTRRGFVTPVEVWPDGEVYITTAKGRQR